MTGISLTLLLLLVFALIVVLIFTRSLTNELEDEKLYNESLKRELDELRLKHPDCKECHGKGLTITGHKVTEFGIIWTYGDADCKVCSGKGTL